MNVWREVHRLSQIMLPERDNRGSVSCIWFSRVRNPWRVVMQSQWNVWLWTARFFQQNLCSSECRNAHISHKRRAFGSVKWAGQGKDHMKMPCVKLDRLHFARDHCKFLCCIDSWPQGSSRFLRLEEVDPTLIRLRAPVNSRVMLLWFWR